MDSGAQVDAIYIDFAKAFYTISHRRLLCKLKSYNINDQLIAWINFLCDRKQRIVLTASFQFGLRSLVVFHRVVFWPVTIFNIY